MNAQTPITLTGLRRALAPWQARWAAQARRIDALSLRERAILFLCLAAVLAALFDSLVLTPLAARAKARAEAATAEAAAVQTLRAQFVAVSGSGTGDPASQLTAQLQAAQAERQRLDRALNQAFQGMGERSSPLQAVLQRLLADTPGLSLRRLALLDDPADATDAGALAGLRWQGVALEVDGPYPAARRYLQSLEQQLPGLRWGELSVSGGQNGRSQVRAQLFVPRAAP